MFRLRLRSWCVSLFACALVLTPVTARAADPYEINAIIAQSGAGAFLAAAQVNVLTTIEENVNKAGGINGRPIKFVIHDDQSNPQVSVQLLNAMIADKVPVVLGSSLTAMCYAMAPLVHDGPVQFCFSPGVSPPSGSYVFTSGISFKDQAEAIMRYFRSTGVKRVAIIATTDASGIAIAKSFDDELALPVNAGIRVVDRETANPADLTVSAQMARIKAAQPDLLLTATAGTPTGTVLHGISDANMPNIPVLLGAGNESYAQMKAYADFLPKNLYFPGIASLVDSQLTDRQLKSIIAEYKAQLHANGVTPDYLQTTAWDPVMMVLSAIRKLGFNATSAQVRDYLATLHGFVGVNGPYDMKERPQRGLDASAIYMVRWDPEKGTWFGVSGPAGTPLPHQSR